MKISKEDISKAKLHIKEEKERWRLKEQWHRAMRCFAVVKEITPLVLKHGGYTICRDEISHYDMILLSRVFKKMGLKVSKKTGRSFIYSIRVYL
jgi:hypothetical protein